MFMQSLMGPFAGLYVLGIPALLALLPLSWVLPVYLTQPLTAGETGSGDVVAAATATTLVAMTFVITGYTVCWRKIEVMFSTNPWLLYTGEVQVGGNARKYALKCPFTGKRQSGWRGDLERICFFGGGMCWKRGLPRRWLRSPMPSHPSLYPVGLKPTLRCPSCDCRVHERGFHRKERLVEFMVGETPLRWDLAKRVFDDSTADVQHVSLHFNEAQGGGHKEAWASDAGLRLCKAPRTFVPQLSPPRQRPPPTPAVGLSVLQHGPRVALADDLMNYPLTHSHAEPLQARPLHRLPWQPLFWIGGQLLYRLRRMDEVL
jgi:hypothetical protein